MISEKGKTLRSYIGLLNGFHVYRLHTYMGKTLVSRKLAIEVNVEPSNDLTRQLTTEERAAWREQVRNDHKLDAANWHKKERYIFDHCQCALCCMRRDRQEAGLRTHWVWFDPRRGYSETEAEFLTRVPSGFIRPPTYHMTDDEAYDALEKAGIVDLNGVPEMEIKDYRTLKKKE